MTLSAYLRRPECEIRFGVRIRAEAFGRVDGVPLLLHELAVVEARDASLQCGILEEVSVPLKAVQGDGKQFVEPARSKFTIFTTPGRSSTWRRPELKVLARTYIELSLLASAEESVDASGRRSAQNL